MYVIIFLCGFAAGLAVVSMAFIIYALHYTKEDELDETAKEIESGAENHSISGKS